MLNAQVSIAGRGINHNYMSHCRSIAFLCFSCKSEKKANGQTFRINDAFGLERNTCVRRLRWPPPIRRAVQVKTRRRLSMAWAMMALTMGRQLFPLLFFLRLPFDSGNFVMLYPAPHLVHVYSCRLLSPSGFHCCRQPRPVTASSCHLSALISYVPLFVSRRLHAFRFASPDYLLFPFP